MILVRWFQSSFQRLVMLVTILLISLVLTTYSFIEYRSVSESWHNMAVEEASNAGYFIALVVADDVKYRRFYELWSKIKRIKQHAESQRQARDERHLFRLQEVVVLDTDAMVLGHTHPESNLLNMPYRGEYRELSKVDGRLIRDHEHGPEADYVASGQFPVVLGNEVIGQVIAKFDMSPVHAYLDELLQRFVAYMLAALLTALLLSLMLARWVTSPLKQLVAQLGLLGTGGVSMRFLDRRHDEFRQLGEALLQADRDIQQRNDELQRHRDQLERLVEERTIELMAAKEEADRANQAKSRFLSHMTHELRTPMNAILGFTQLLSLSGQQGDDTDVEKQQLFLAEITKAGDHLMALINDVLDLSCIEAGKLNIEMETVEIAPLVQDCIALIEPMAQERGVILLDASCRLTQYRVLADATRLKQAVINLLSNAVKYNRPEGRVHIQTGTTDDGRFLISIRDTGLGLSDEQLSRLFTPFDRLDKEGGRVEGTGIGLVIAKELLELMDGELTVSSEQDKGSTFNLYLKRVVSPSDESDAVSGTGV